MKKLLDTLDSLTDTPLAPNGKTQVKGFGLISCGNTVHIRHVPFDTPCIILVLSGRKVMFENGRKIVCDAGGVLCVPSPRSYDLRNEPDPNTGRYRALVIPFQRPHLERLCQAHDLAGHRPEEVPCILHFKNNPLSIAAIEHYLTSGTDNYLLDHRLLEVLLILVREDNRLLAYVFAAKDWSQRVRAVLATDLSRKWEIAEICHRLATSESTLRRHLKREQTGFRDLLSEQRLTSALMQLLQTSLPVTRIAYDCGYQSVSRFSSNFSKRFGLPPSAFRDALNESEHTLTVSGQPIVD
ncbi:MAG: helix-turn-helix transcriptional regulator [Candidatus Thiodiazotropha sp. (ex Dulcina madagascariensis)]|nr:helix-turn-helix transcriptional regulator [Candidatus Thiodiazotropha sp. (ex Dulcina madagascariensis)]